MTKQENPFERSVLEGPHSIGNVYWEIVETRVGPQAHYFRRYEYEGQERAAHTYARAESEDLGKCICAVEQWFGEEEAANAA